MIFWPHNDDLTQPPRIQDLTYQRPHRGPLGTRLQQSRRPRHQTEKQDTNG